MHVDHPDLTRGRSGKLNLYCVKFAFTTIVPALTVAFKEHDMAEKPSYKELERRIQVLEKAESERSLAEDRLKRFSTTRKMRF